MYYSLLLICAECEREFVEAELYGLGTCGITEHDLPGGVCELEAFFAERFDELAQFAAYSPVWRESAVGADAETWVDTFEPFAIGEKLFVVPAWRDDPAPQGRLRLPVHARQASGSGYQPATQMALEAMERHLTPDARFLDAGTGSGILCEAARLLGSGPRFACDIDLAALAEARENQTPAALFGGSPRSLASGAVDLLAANLNAQALLGLQAELLRVLRPQGVMILSGFTARNEGRIEAAFAPGAAVIERLSSAHWRCLVLRAH